MITDLVPGKLKQAIQSILRVYGYRLTRIEPVNQNLSLFFSSVKRFGFAPKQIWDVGANHGNWTRAALRFFPQAEYTLIEPQDELKSHVEDLIRNGHRIRWINAGAGARSGVLPFYIGPSDESSSFMNSARIKDGAVSKAEIIMRTLNEIRESFSLPVPEMLKIDAEGLDLQVLKGASELIGKTEVVLAEASIGQFDFENKALALMAMMDDLGYRLIDITDLNRSPNHGVLWLCEFAFLLKSSQLLASASRY